MIGKERFEFLQKITSEFKLVHAQIMGVDESKPGLYKCKVFPDLIELEDTADFPWYPSSSPGKKDYVVGDFVWAYVTEDLWIGYVINKLNTYSQDVELQKEVFDSVVASLLEIESDIPHALDYNTCAYVPLTPSVFLIWDKSFAGILNVENKSLISLSSGNVLIGGTNLHITNTVKIGSGASAAARADSLQDILDAIETHRHFTPMGPTAGPVTKDFKPLNLKLSKFRKTMESTKLTIE